MGHPLIQGWASEVRSVLNGHALRWHTFIAKKLKKSMCFQTISQLQLIWHCLSIKPEYIIYMYIILYK